MYICLETSYGLVCPWTLRRRDKAPYGPQKRGEKPKEKSLLVPSYGLVSLCGADVATPWCLV
jgi:hypothetical protein